MNLGYKVSKKLCAKLRRYRKGGLNKNYKIEEEVRNLKLDTIGKIKRKVLKRERERELRY